jgi:hypothetical protein
MGKKIIESYCGPIFACRQQEKTRQTPFMTDDTDRHLNWYFPYISHATAEITRSMTNECHKTDGIAEVETDWII